MFDEPEPEATEDDYTEPDNMQVDVVLAGDLIEMENTDCSVEIVRCRTSGKANEWRKADMVFTDPPYGMNAVTKSGVLSKNYRNDIIRR